MNSIIASMRSTLRTAAMMTPSGPMVKPDDCMSVTTGKNRRFAMAKRMNIGRNVAMKVMMVLPPVMADVSSDTPMMSPKSHQLFIMPSIMSWMIAPADISGCSPSSLPASPWSMRLSMGDLYPIR